MKKILSISICLLFCIICFCGCANVSYRVNIEETGEVVQYFTVQFDSEAIQDSNANMNLVKEKLYNSVVSYYNTLKTNFIYRGDYPVTQKQSWLRSNIGNLPAVELNYYYPDAYTYSYTLSFANVSAYAFFYDIDLENSTPTYTYEENPFFNTRIETTNTIYNNLKDSSLLSTLENIFEEEFNFQFDSSDLNYQFIFIEEQAHIRSDADDVIYKNGKYYHSYNMSLDETSKEIHFYKYTIKSEAWYLSALLLTFVLLLICYIINKLIIRKNRKVANMSVDNIIIDDVINTDKNEVITDINNSENTK